MAETQSSFILATQNITLAVLAVQVWDTLVSVRTEYSLIWRAQWSKLKVAYLLSRYWGIATTAFQLWAFTSQVPYTSCRTVVHLIAAFGAICTMASGAVLALRTYALFDRPAWLRNLCILALTCELAFLSAATFRLKPLSQPGETDICLPVKVTSAQGINFCYFLVPFVVDTTFTSLCTYRAICLSRGTGMSSLLRVFTRDGLIYFFVTALLNLVESAFYLQPNMAMQSMLAPPAIGLSSVMCCRLVLSLRNHAAHASNRPILPSIEVHQILCTLPTGHTDKSGASTPGLGTLPSPRISLTSGSPSDVKIIMEGDSSTCQPTGGRACGPSLPPPGHAQPGSQARALR